jgi:hypothetical protein
VKEDTNAQFFVVATPSSSAYMANVCGFVNDNVSDFFLNISDQRQVLFCFALVEISSEYVTSNVMKNHKRMRRELLFCFLLMVFPACLYNLTHISF